MAQEDKIDCFGGTTNSIQVIAFAGSSELAKKKPAKCRRVVVVVVVLNGKS